MLAKFYKPSERNRTMCFKTKTKKLCRFRQEERNLDAVDKGMHLPLFIGNQNGIVYVLLNKNDQMKRVKQHDEQQKTSSFLVTQRSLGIFSPTPLPCH